MNHLNKTLARHLVKATLILSQVACSGAGFSQSPQPAPSRPVSHPTAQTAPASPSRYTPNHFPKRALMYYQNVWGIDSLTVRAAESGELIRFNYRVLDPVRAGQLNDKKFEPSLVDLRAGVRLVIPSLEKVGQLRQSVTPEEGKIYWMAFSNPRRTVKPGDRVNVVIGHFHADGLIVE
jgi:hypothetical protein